VFAVDTNIFVYAHFDRYPQHDKARRFCEQQLLAALQQVVWARERRGA